MVILGWQLCWLIMVGEVEMIVGVLVMVLRGWWLMYMWCVYVLVMMVVMGVGLCWWGYASGQMVLVLVGIGDVGRGSGDDWRMVVVWVVMVLVVVMVVRVMECVMMVARGVNGVEGNLVVMFGGVDDADDGDGCRGGSGDD